MLNTKKFQRKIEDFVCENCGAKVYGNGYTDHCPFCLWSRHLDVNPGDRSSNCRGMMKPSGIEIKGKENLILYKCLKCGFKHKVKSAKEDDFNEILKLSSSQIQY